MGTFLGLIFVEGFVVVLEKGSHAGWDEIGKWGLCYICLKFAVKFLLLLHFLLLLNLKMKIRLKVL